MVTGFDLLEDSDLDTTSSSELSFLKTSSDEEDKPPELRMRHGSGEHPKKKFLIPEQQSQLLVKKDPPTFFDDCTRATKYFKREQKANRHDDIDQPFNKSQALSIWGISKIKTQKDAWRRMAEELDIQVPPAGSDFEEKMKSNEINWSEATDYYENTPDELPVSHCIYEEEFYPPDLEIPLPVSDKAPGRSANHIPIVPPAMHVLEGGIVHVFDRRCLRTYRVWDQQEFTMISSLRFDEMSNKEQLTCISFVHTRHSVALGFADGSAAICRLAIDHSTQEGRGRHNFEYFMAPAEPGAIITHISQSPCSARFNAIAYFDAKTMSYIVRVIDMDRMMDEEGNITETTAKEKEYYSQYSPTVRFGAQQGPFRSVDAKSTLELSLAKHNVRLLSLRTVERVTDIMWFSDRTTQLMIFAEKSMRLIDVSKEDQEKVLKSCTLEHPLTYPTTHPGRPTLFSALDRHMVVIYDRRCLKSPICKIDVPEDTLGRGIPNRAIWCPSDMNKLVVHYKHSQRATLIQFNRYPDCSQLTDGACVDDDVSPQLSRYPEHKDEEGEEKYRWGYKKSEDYPEFVGDYFLAEEDLEGGLMEAAPFPEEWRHTTEPLVWRAEFDLKSLPSICTTKVLRRTFSDPDITTYDDHDQFVHPLKRYMSVARDRRQETVERECVEWRLWNEFKRVSKKRRTKSEERTVRGAEPLRQARFAATVELKRPIRKISKTTSYDSDIHKGEVMYPSYTSNFVNKAEIARMSHIRRESITSNGRLTDESDHLDDVNYDKEDHPKIPGPYTADDGSYRYHPMNQSRIPQVYGNLYYGVQGRPLSKMRSVMDHARFFVKNDDGKGGHLLKRSKKILIKEKRIDDIMRRMMDEEADLMSANDCRWLNYLDVLEGRCVPEEPRNDPLVQRLRKGRIGDTSDSDVSSTVHPNDDVLIRYNGVKQVNKHDFQFIPDRSLFGAADTKRPEATAPYDFIEFELPTDDIVCICVFAYSQEMIVQGTPGDFREGPHLHFMKVPSPLCLPKRTERRLGVPQVADMSLYLRSVFGNNMLHNVKQVKKSGFGEFNGADIPKGYMSTMKHLRKHIEDSDGNRFALDYLERMFNDNHVMDHDRGFPTRFEIDNPEYSDTTDEDDPKKKKKKNVFTAQDDRPKMEQLKEKLLKKRRAKFLQRRRACEELKLDHDTLFAAKEPREQKSLFELALKGDPKRSILDEPVPKELYDRYSASSDSNEEAHPLPAVLPREFKNKDGEYDFDIEEQKIAMETREINIIKAFRSRGEIPPLEFEYDANGIMLPPRPATLEEERDLDICHTRTLLRRMLERDARVNELKRRREAMVDRLPEEVCEDTYDRMMSDMRVLFDELETSEASLAMKGYFFTRQKGKRCKYLYGRGWKRNRKVQHKYLNECLNLCDLVYKIRRDLRLKETTEAKQMRDFKKARKEAKKLLREIARRDVSGRYMRKIIEHQFRPQHPMRDIDINDFLKVFEEYTLQMCGRQFDSHQQLIRKIKRRRKIKLDSWDEEVVLSDTSDLRPVLTDQSDSEAENKPVSSSPLDSSSDPCFVPLQLEGRKKKRMKRRSKITEERGSKSREKSEAEEEMRIVNGVDYSAQVKQTADCTLSDCESEPMDEVEILEKNPKEYLPTRPRLFFESAAAAMPISVILPIASDPMKEAAIFNIADLKPPPGIKKRRNDKFKNRKARKKRDYKRRLAAEAKMKAERRERDEKLYEEMLELADRWSISTSAERESDWKIKREENAKEWRRMSHSGSPGGKHRSLTRKLFDKLKISGGTGKLIRLYSNGSIWPPPKTPFSTCFDKFDQLQNPFAHRPAPPSGGRRPQATFLADRDEEELSFGYDLGNQKSMLPPDEFSFPLKTGEIRPNNVQWMFPKYWEKRESKRTKQKRKRQKRWLQRARSGTLKKKLFECLEPKQPASNSNSNKTTTTRISTLNEVPVLSKDEVVMAKYVCIGNPGLQRGVSAVDFLHKDSRFINEEIVFPKRARSCFPRITEVKESIAVFQAAFGSDTSSETSFDPFKAALKMQKEQGSPFAEFRRQIALDAEKAKLLEDTKPIPFLISPSHSDEEEEDETTPMPSIDPDETPVVTPEHRRKIEIMIHYPLRIRVEPNEEEGKKEEETKGVEMKEEEGKEEENKDEDVKDEEITREEEPQSDTDTFFDIEDMEKEKQTGASEEVEVLVPMSSHTVDTTSLVDTEVAVEAIPQPVGEYERNPLIDSRRVRPIRKAPPPRPARDPEVERQIKARFDFLMEKLLFEEMGIVPDRIANKTDEQKRDITIDPFLRGSNDIMDKVPAAWLTLNKNHKFKKIVPRDFIPSLATVFDVNDENVQNYGEIRFSDGFTPMAFRPYIQTLKRCEQQLTVKPVKIRPGTPIVDISSPDSDDSDDEFDSVKSVGEDEDLVPLRLPEDLPEENEVAPMNVKENGMESDIEDEHYEEDDQVDHELIGFLKSDSEDEIGDDLKVVQQNKMISLDLPSMAPPITIPIIKPEPIRHYSIESMFAGSSTDSNHLEDDEAADMEVQNVFGQNLVPPPRPPPPEEPPKEPTPPPVEERPVSVEYGEEVSDTVTVAEEAFDFLITPPPKVPTPPVKIPDAIIRPERLLDLMPPSLIFEGVDYWGCTEQEMEEALDELITERERIRAELLKPPPKPRHVYQLVHNELVDGVDQEVIALEFSSSESDPEDQEEEEEEQEEEEEFEEEESSSDSSSETVLNQDSDPMSGMKKVDEENEETEGGNKKKRRPPTPPHTPDSEMPLRDRRRMQDRKRHAREFEMDKIIEDEAWKCFVENKQSEFAPDGYGRRTTIFREEENLIRGTPRHLLVAYLDQMRVRRYEENLLLEQLEQENHLYRLKIEKPPPSPPFDPIHPVIIQPELPPRDITLTFTEPEFVVPVRVHQPILGASPHRPSILKRRRPPVSSDSDAETETESEPDVEYEVPKAPDPSPEIPEEEEEEEEDDVFEDEPVRTSSTSSPPANSFYKREWFKKRVKKVEPPNADDTRFPTEEDYSVEVAKQYRFEATKDMLRPGTSQYSRKFIYKCKGIPGLIHIAMNEISPRKDYVKDTRLVGIFYVMRSRERIAVLRSIGFCDYKTDHISEILEQRRQNHENPFCIVLMALMMGQGTYVVSFLTRLQRGGWYPHKDEDTRVRDEAELLMRFCLLYCSWRVEHSRRSVADTNKIRRSLLDKYLTYKNCENTCLFTRAFMAFLLTVAYSETRHFVDDVVWCKQMPTMFRVAFATLFYESSDEWQQTLVEMLKEMPPHDIQRFAFTGVGRHPDSINAILEFAKHTSDVQFASFLLIAGKCLETHPFAKKRQFYEKRSNATLAPRGEAYKYWFAINNEIEMTKDLKKMKRLYPELVKSQQAILALSLKYEIYQAMTHKARPTMEQLFPVAVLYPHVDMKKLEQQAYEVLRHYAYILQVTHNWTAAAQIFYIMDDGEAQGRSDRFDTETEYACSFCCTTLSYGRKKAREDKKAEKKKTEEARVKHMEAQRKRMEQGLQPQPFTGGTKKKPPTKDIPDDVDTSLRPIACLGCHKPLPRCAVCFNHMFNPIPNEEGRRGEQVGFGFAACRRCHHGGHPDHLDRWFRENYRCPVSKCQCECDYDNVWDALKLHEALDMKLLGAPQIALGTHQRILRTTPSTPAEYLDEEEEEEEKPEIPVAVEERVQRDQRSDSDDSYDSSEYGFRIE